jgi:non-haem Fe2+, alpha-ketoglutarate-dependent halogenase
MDLRALRDKFERDGYAAPVPALSSEEVKRYRQAYDDLEARWKQEGSLKRPTHQHFKIKEFWELASHPKVLDYAKATVGDDVVLIATGFFSKPPSTADKFVAWHQDTTYWGLDPSFAVTVWIAIDDSDVENGCMRVIPGTHRSLLPHGKAQKAGNMLGMDQEIDTTYIDENKAVDLVLKAGEASLHQGWTVHGSNPNRSSRRRCGMTIRFTRPDVKPVPGVFVDKPILMCGEDKYGNFEYHPKPVFE